MGKRTKSREARRHQHHNMVCAVLKSHSQASAPARVAARYDDFKPERREKVEALRSHALRMPEDWRCRIKSRSEDRRFIDLVRFCFARYRVPVHLEHLWLDEVQDDFVDRIVMPEVETCRQPGRPHLRRWYLIAAQGGSLYKQATHPWLSKQETHHYLNTPADIAVARTALWYAVARAQTDSPHLATKVARSKVANYSIASTWWKEVARFFARNPMSTHAMDDLVDFLFVARQEDPGFALKGRTLTSLRRRMQDWHRALRRSQEVGGGAWAGSALPDIDYTSGSESRKAVWRFRQIKTGNALYREGERMHHCVASYKFACMQGLISIWSLTSEFPPGRVNRGVTMEVTRDGRIVQCRGFANRLPYGNEATMAKRWAREHGLTWTSAER